MCPLSTCQEGQGSRDWEPVNQAKALWTRPRAEITDEDYTQFYEHVAHDHTAPLGQPTSRTTARPGARSPGSAASAEAQAPQEPLREHRGTGDVSGREGCGRGV